MLDPKYKKDDIVIINQFGVLKKRHIYGETPSLIKKGETSYYLYHIDYGLGLTSEGCVTEEDIICIANESHKNIAL